MCKHCGDTGKIITIDGSLVKFEPCYYCETYKANEKRALLEIQELLGEVEGRRRVRIAK